MQSHTFGRLHWCCLCDGTRGMRRHGVCTFCSDVTSFTPMSHQATVTLLLALPLPCWCSGNAEHVCRCHVALCAGLWDPYNDAHMGNCAELCATHYQISREEMDDHAIEAFQRAQAAAPYMQAEVVPVQLPPTKAAPQGSLLDHDESLGKMNEEKLRGLKPFFKQVGGRNWLRLGHRRLDNTRASLHCPHVVHGGSTNICTALVPNAAPAALPSDEAAVQPLSTLKSNSALTQGYSSHSCSASPHTRNHGGC